MVIEPESIPEFKWKKKRQDVWTLFFFFKTISNHKILVQLLVLIRLGFFSKNVDHPTRCCKFVKFLFLSFSCFSHLCFICVFTILFPFCFCFSKRIFQVKKICKFFPVVVCRPKIYIYGVQIVSFWIPKIGHNTICLLLSWWFCYCVCFSEKLFAIFFQSSPFMLYLGVLVVFLFRVVSVYLVSCPLLWFMQCQQQ